MLRYACRHRQEPCCRTRLFFCLLWRSQFCSDTLWALARVRADLYRYAMRTTCSRGGRCASRHPTGANGCTGDPPNPINTPAGDRGGTPRLYGMESRATAPPPLVPMKHERSVARYLYGAQSERRLRRWDEKVLERHFCLEKDHD